MATGAKGVFELTPQAIALIGGIAFLALAVFGGDIKMKDYLVPQLPTLGRVVAAFLGLALCLPFAMTELRGSRDKAIADPVLPTSTPASPSATPSDPVVPPSVILESPAENAEIVGAEGVVVSGVVTNIEGDTLWVFDVAEGPSGRPSFFRVNERPIETAGGRFSITDKPIGGGASDVGAYFTVALVRASTDCSKILLDAKPDSKTGNIVFDPLPPGCREIGKRTVKKVAP